MRPEGYRELFAGMAAALPVVPGIAAGGVLYGAASVELGIEPLTTVAGSLLIATGTAQFVALDLLGDGRPVALVVLVGLLINLRFAVYGLHLGPVAADLPWWRRWAYYGLLTDEGYAMTLARGRSDDAERGTKVPGLFAWSLGVMVLTWSAWLLGGGVGAYAGRILPPSRLLELAVPLTLLGVLALLTRSHRHLWAAAVAGLVGALLRSAPMGLGLVAAIAAGVAVGIAGRAPKGIEAPKDSEAPASTARAVGSEGL